MSSLLDLTALTELAQRLVGAAHRAGADAADALAVRAVSLGVEVREGAVEESERSEGDDLGLRVFVGRRQAVISTNDIKIDMSQLAERAVAMSWAFEGNCAKTGEYERRVIDYWNTQEHANPANAFYQEGEMADEAARVCIDAGDLNAAADWYRKGH